jgi:NADPH:quinone reductase-like Zn-dependent oxidoreductase
VQVRVTAAALNHIDSVAARRAAALRVALPHVPGGDVCGVVSALGPASRRCRARPRRSRPGQPGLSCGRCVACLRARQLLPAFGCWASRRTAAQRSTSSFPPPTWSRRRARACRSDDAQLASIPTVFMTAWQMLVERAAIQQGETVLVHRRRLRRRHGRDPDREAVGRARDRDRVDRRKLARRARSAPTRPSNTHADIVAEVKTADRPARRRHRGRPRRRRDLRQVGAGRARGGASSSAARPSGYEPKLNLRHVFWRQLSVLGSTMASKAALHAPGPVRGRAPEAVVDRCCPWPRLPRAPSSRIAAVFGKLVLTP